MAGDPLAAPEFQAPPPYEDPGFQPYPEPCLPYGAADQLPLEQQPTQVFQPLPEPAYQQMTQAYQQVRTPGYDQPVQGRPAYGAPGAMPAGHGYPGDREGVG